MIGKKLGHYEVVEKLGEGGMGVVYKARDTHLDRFVAVKVLPPEKVSDPVRKARFVQEAKAASALNHPNIITIHDISSEAGCDFIAMEYVAGKTLDQIIPRKGMHLNEALKIGVQIAEALARAHEAGIVHRDLKPANVMVDEKGRVKVVDFGLAKLLEREILEDAKTMPMEVKTKEGAITGTVAYMSPEQAEGKKVDARSDIFSFGTVLYEMVTGQRAFQGDSSMSTLTAVLHKEPPVIPGDVPYDLTKVITRCMRKDPERRFQHMGDVRIALEDLKEESDSGRLVTFPTSVPRKTSKLTATAIVLAMGLVCLAGWLLWREKGGNSPLPKLIQLTSFPGSEMYPTFSPDGNQIAFVWNGEKGDNVDIYVKMVEDTNVLRLTSDPASDLFPAWSPDGKRIAFLRFASGQPAAIHLVSPLGGSAKKVAEIPVYGPMSWSPDGKWIAVGCKSAGICLVPVEGGESRSLATDQTPTVNVSPAFSPEGSHLVYAACTNFSCDIYLRDLDKQYTPRGGPRRITNQGLAILGIAWSPDGNSILYGGSASAAAISSIWRLDLKANSPPLRMEMMGWGAYPAVSLAGSRLAFSRYWDNRDIWRYRPGGITDPLIVSSLADMNPEFSPDGKRIVFASLRSGEASEIWMANSDGSNQIQLTNRLGRHQGSPRWSPDGRRIAFDSQDAGGIFHVWVLEVNGGQARRLTGESSSEHNPSWSRDGNWIYFYSDRTGRPEIWRGKVADGKIEQITRDGGFAAFESLDGRTLFYMKNQNSPLYSKSLDRGPEKQMIDWVTFRAFTVVENGIYYIGRGDENGLFPLRFFQLSTGQTQELTKLEHPANYGMTVSPDRKTFLFTKDVSSGSDLMMVENFR